MRRLILNTYSCYERWNVSISYRLNTLRCHGLNQTSTLIVIVECVLVFLRYIRIREVLYSNLKTLRAIRIDIGSDFHVNDLSLRILNKGITFSVGARHTPDGQ